MIWKRHPYIRFLEVSDKGHLRNFWSKKLHKSNIYNGRYRITIRGKTYQLNRLVAETFLPNPNNLPQVNHKDENPKNNEVSNLEWCTAKYNSNYGTRNRRMALALLGHPMWGQLGKPKIAILQFKDNHCVGYYESAEAAGRLTGVGSSHIRECCRFDRHTAGGFIWRNEFDSSLYLGLI